jgi:hypothetical protein
VGSRHGGEDYMLCQIKIMHRFTSNTTADSQSLPASVVVDCLVGRDYSTSANDGQLVQINSAGCRFESRRGRHRRGSKSGPLIGLFLRALRLARMEATSPAATVRGMV